MQVHPSLSPPFLLHTPPTSRLVMRNKPRLCTVFTQNILCLASCPCTQNSCCSSSSTSDCQGFESYLSASKKQKAQKRLKAPPTHHHRRHHLQTSSRQQCSVLHKKREGGKKKRHENPNGLPEGENNKARKTDDAADRPHIQIQTDAGVHTHTHKHTSAIPLQESFLFFLLLNPSVLMIHNA